MCEIVLWILIFVANNPRGQIEVERYKSAEQCNERLQDYAPYPEMTKVPPICVHAFQPWRQIEISGPNASEVRERELEKNGAIYQDSYSACKVKPTPSLKR